MRFPIQLHFDMTRYLLSNQIKGTRRFPLVLMLEPTHQCNLNCLGCGRIREYKQTLNQSLSFEDCLDSVDQAGAPVVTITGGEPFLVPYLGRLVRAVLHRRKHVYLCTNGTLVGERLNQLTPDPRLTLNIHLDAFGEEHDRIMNRKGMFEEAVAAVRFAKSQGFRVSTNTTVYKESDPANLLKLFDVLKSLGVDGILVSPGFEYESVGNDMFLNRRRIHEIFRELSPSFSKYPIISTPLFLEFLRGERNLSCTPWGNPTRNPAGWKSPCYLITDTHYATFRELMEQTDWDRYEAGEDPRCRDCMVHCGYEASVVRTLGKSPRDLAKMILWNLNA